MDEKKIESMAMFRYGVIVPLLNLDERHVLVTEMRLLANRIWILPDGRHRQFAWGTLEDWYYDFQRGGFEALRKGARRDAGTFRALDAAVCERIDQLLQKHPSASGRNIIRILKKERMVVGGRPSESTIHRYLRANRPSVAEETADRERRAFEAPYAGYLWQTDVMYGPYVTVRDPRGRRSKKQTYLMAIIDDHSRLACYGQFYLDQNLTSYLNCFKKAVARRGVPQRLYCDNGQVFTSCRTRRIAAKIATQLLFTKIRDASAKGKIEKFFRTVRDQFLAMHRLTRAPETLEELNREFALWLDEYNQTVHSSTGASPVDRWLASSYKVRLISVSELDRAFRFEDTRKVRKDGTFSFNGTRYETDSHLAGKKVTVEYDPFAPERVRVVCEGADYGVANPLDPAFNASGRRRKLDGKEPGHGK